MSEPKRKDDRSLQPLRPEPDPLLREPRGVRSRAVRHLRRALGAGAVAAGAACGCGEMVDPGPPPLICSDSLTSSSLFGELIGVSATWRNAGDHLSVELAFHPTFYRGDPLAFVTPLEVTGGTVEDHTTGEEATALIRPDVGATTMRVRQPLDCDGIGEAIVVELDVSGTPSAGSPVPVQPATDE